MDGWFDSHARTSRDRGTNFLFQNRRRYALDTVTLGNTSDRSVKNQFATDSLYSSASVVYQSAPRAAPELLKGRRRKSFGEPTINSSQQPTASTHLPWCLHRWLQLSRPAVLAISRAADGPRRAPAGNTLRLFITRASRRQQQLSLEAINLRLPPTLPTGLQGLHRLRQGS